MGAAGGTASGVDGGVGKEESAGEGGGLGGSVGTRVGAGLGVDVGAGEARGEGTGVGAGGRECGKGEGTREETVPQRRQYSTAAGAAAPLHLAPDPNPDYNADGLIGEQPDYEDGMAGQGYKRGMERPQKRLRDGGAEAHRLDEETVEEKLRERRVRLWLAARAKESRAPSPAQRKGGGQAAEHGVSTGAQGGNVVGGKRKATAASAVETERAEKRRRERCSGRTYVQLCVEC